MSHQDKLDKIKYTLIFMCVPVIFIIYASTLMYLTWPISELSVNKSGSFGDSFGVLTALFSGLAFSGMLITILLQRKELSLQRIELGLTREQLKRSADAADEQVDHLNSQKIREDLYRLISALSDRVSDLYQNSQLLSGDTLKYLVEEKIRNPNNVAFEKLKSHGKDNLTTTYRMVYSITNDLGSIINLLKEYEAVSYKNRDQNPLRTYYITEYKELAEMLADNDLLDKSGIVYKYFCVHE